MRRVPTVDINKKDSYDGYALTNAACHGCVQVLHALLADPRLDKAVRWSGGCTAVGMARRYTKGDWEEAVALVLRHGCPE